MSRIPPGWTPDWMEVAQRFYDDAFGPRNTTDLSASMEEWSHLTPDEQLFTLAHLRYVGLQGEVTTQRMLRRTCRLLERMGGSLDEFLDRMEEYDELSLSEQEQEVNVASEVETVPEEAAPTDVPHEDLEEAEPKKA